MTRHYRLAVLAAALLIILACAGAEAPAAEPATTQAPLVAPESIDTQEPDDANAGDSPETEEPGSAGAAAGAEEPTAGEAATITPTPPVAPGQPTRTMDSHVEVSVSSTSPKVGDLITISGRAVDVGLPKFTISFTSGGQYQVDYENNKNVEAEDPLFELISIEGQGPMLTIVLKAIAAGSTVVTIYASGEVQTLDDSGNPVYSWGGGGSDQIAIEITE
jgi:hypothetical protein